MNHVHILGFPNQMLLEFDENLQQPC
jgi:hypothetical protein